VRDPLTIEGIEAADVVIVSSDIHIDMSRFAGKPMYAAFTTEAIRYSRTVIEAAIHNGAEMVEKAFAEATTLGVEGKKAALTGDVQQIKKLRAVSRTGPYKHLMTGVSYMLPFVVAGGLLIALAFAFGGIYIYENENTFGWALFQIGAPSAFALTVPILAGFIAYSIADRSGIAPGIVGGMLAGSIGAGFLSGIIAGFIAGYATDFLSKHSKLGSRNGLRWWPTTKKKYLLEWAKFNRDVLAQHIIIVAGTTAKCWNKP
jgi:PTS system fructose-specific IIC component